MKTLAHLLHALVIALWIVGIAIFSIQNLQPLSLKFLWFNSITLTSGVMLSLSAGIGFIWGGILFQPQGKTLKSRSSSSRSNPRKSLFSRPRRDSFKSSPSRERDWGEQIPEDW